MDGLFDLIVSENPVFVDSAEQFAKRAEVARDQALTSASLADASSKSAASSATASANSAKGVSTALDSMKTSLASIKTFSDNVTATSATVSTMKNDVSNIRDEANATSATIEANKVEVNQAYQDTLKAKNDVTALKTATDASQKAAKISETNSKTSETNALASANKAQDWAEKMGAPITGTSYSAKHWADVASKSFAGTKTFKGRSGDVVPVAGDYTAAMVGAVAKAGDTMTGNLTVPKVLVTTDQGTESNSVARRDFVESVASGLVPNTTTINSEPLTGNIVLTAVDVGAVPLTTTINGKKLNSNINLTAADIGAMPLDGAATAAGYLKRIDSRNDNKAPSALNDGFTQEFKSNTTDGFNQGGTFHTVLSMKQWSEKSGGTAKQLAFGDDGKMALRVGTADYGAWSPWSFIYTDANKPTANDVGALPATYVPDWAAITNKPAQATRWPVWDEVTGKPTTMAPSAHKHPWADITGVPTFATRWPTAAEVKARPDNWNPDVLSMRDNPDANIPTTVGYSAFTNTATAKNFPKASLGSGYEVVRGQADGKNVDSAIFQLWNPNDSTEVYIRTGDGSATGWVFRVWERLYTSAYKPSAADVGAKPANYVPTWAEVTGKVVASASVDGLMVKTDKVKLDGLSNYTHPTGDGNLHVPATGTTNLNKVLKAGALAGEIGWGTLTAADVGAKPVGWVPSWNDISDKPNTFADKDHVHKGSSITPIQLAKEDLDNIKTAGFYAQQANANTSTAQHYPENNAGSLVVTDGAGPKQTYHVYNSSRIYTRSQYGSGGWTPWVRQYNTEFKPNAGDVGAVSKAGDTMTGTLVINTDATGVSINRDEYPNLLLVSANQTDTKNKLLEVNNKGDLTIITRKADNSNNGVITIPAGESGTVYHTGRAPTADEVGALSKTTGTINTSVDWNAYEGTGFYNVYKGANITFINAPASFEFGTLQVIGSGKAANTFVTQIATSKSNGAMFVRTRNDGAMAWTPWIKQYNEAQKPTAADVGARPSNWVPAWGDVTGKPATMAPSAHTHPWSQLTGIPVQATRWPTPEEVKARPDTWVPDSLSTKDYADANIPLNVGFSTFTSAVTAKNFPKAAPGCGYEIVRGQVDGKNVDCSIFQLWSPNDSTEVFIRTGDGTTGGWVFRAWEKLYTSLNKPTATDVGARPSNWVPTWNDVTLKPVFASRWPTLDEIKAKPASYVPTWAEVTGKPADFAPSAHKHVWADITGVPVQATRWPTAVEAGALPIGGGTLTGVVTAPDFIQSTAQSTNVASCTRRDYVDGLLATKLNLTGGTVTGNITAPDFLQSTAQSTNAASCTRKDYVDAQVKGVEDRNVNRAGDTMTGTLVINNNSPTFWFQDTDNRSAAIHVNTNLFYVLRGTGNNAVAFDGGPNGRHPMTLNLENGDVVFSGNVVAYSDKRLKKDVKPLENALEKVLKLDGVNYKRIGNDTDRVECGFIAQDLQKVIPEVVIEQADEDKTLAVDYAKMNAYLVEAIKEQQKMIEELKSQIEEIKGGTK